MRQRVLRRLAAAATVIALVGAPGAAWATEDQDDDPATEGEFRLDLDLPPRVALGPVAGLGALVEHLALGDPAGQVEPGVEGAHVAVLQSRLASMGFRPGPIDGVFGGQTYSAVLALQKHEGLERTGVLDETTRVALEGLRSSGPRTDLLGNRIEVDLVRQLIFVVRNDDLTIINTSTGNGAPYARYDGTTAIARTPRGSFAIGRRYNGSETSYLGTLYRPMYFYGGYAIHGSGSVPAYPASHGCVRTSYGDIDFLWTIIPTGMSVYTYA